MKKINLNEKIELNERHPVKKQRLKFYIGYDLKGFAQIILLLAQKLQ